MNHHIRTRVRPSDDVSGSLMWLPPNERKLLRIYYGSRVKYLRNGACAVTAKFWYDVDELASVYRRRLFNQAVAHLNVELPRTWKAVPSLEKSPSPTHTQIYTINDVLEKRGLLDVPYNGRPQFPVGFTLDGYDLARKYANWFTRSGLWFSEFKRHWLWLLFAFLAGVAFKIFADLVVSCLTIRPGGIPGTP
jgi:hypothetical protein